MAVKKLKAVATTDPVRQVEDIEDSQPDSFEIKQWVNTVIEAEEIKADPEKMKFVGPALTAKHQAMSGPIKTMQELKMKANGMSETPETDEAE